MTYFLQSELRRELRGAVDTDSDGYYEACLSRIACGEPTWMVRNDTQGGEVYDYFAGGHHIGFLDVSTSGATVRAYIETPGETPVLLGEYEDAALAISSLQTALRPREN